MIPQIRRVLKQLVCRHEWPEKSTKPDDLERFKIDVSYMCETCGQGKQPKLDTCSCNGKDWKCNGKLYPYIEVSDFQYWLESIQEGK